MCPVCDQLCTDEDALSAHCNEAHNGVDIQLNEGQTIIGVNRPVIVREIPHFGAFPSFLPERPAFLDLFRNKNKIVIILAIWRHFGRKSSAKT